MLNNARARARRYNLPFRLTMDDVSVPDACPVYGVPLRCVVGRRGGGPWSPSLDRIVPALGYVPGNVQVVSRKFNTIKSNAEPHEIAGAALFCLNSDKQGDSK